ncbi:MAG: DUF2914 domain-containing protein [Myxococcota bacterium]
MSNQNPIIRFIVRAVRALVIAFMAIPGAGLALVAYSCGEAPDREIAPPPSSQSRGFGDTQAEADAATAPRSVPVAARDSVPPPVTREVRGAVAKAAAAPAAEALPAPRPVLAVAPAPELAPRAVVAADAPAPEAVALQVLNSALGTGVEAREPTGVAAAFTAGADQVYAWFQVENAGPPTTVTLTWLRDGEARASVSLEVGTSPRWRTWARRRLAPTDAGEWTAELRDASGALLQTLNFAVSAPDPTLGLL